MEREITITKDEYDNLMLSDYLLALYRETLKRCCVYSEWRKSGVSFDEERILDTIRIFDQKEAWYIETECDRQKRLKEDAEAEAMNRFSKAEAEVITVGAEKPSFPEIKKEGE